MVLRQVSTRRCVATVQFVISDPNSLRKDLDGGGLAIVIPTKDRPIDLMALLDNLERQSRLPAEIVVVDGSDQPIRALLDERHSTIPLQYIRHRPPSAAAQRNAGIARLAGRYPLIGLLDDDIELAPDAIERMLEFWRTKESLGVGGAAFNQLGSEEISEQSSLKRSRLAESLGLYCRKPGRVARSGWHTMVGTVAENTPVEWLTTCAAIWRAEVFQRHRFDEYFRSYSYLEDLDFSYGVSREFRLRVVASARYRHLHHHASLTSEWYREFGASEVRNRLYFVRKQGLSVPSCYLGLTIRLSQTIAEATLRRRPVLFSRAMGNLEGLATQAIAHDERPRANSEDRNPPES